MTEAQVEAIVIMLAEIREELKLLNKMTRVAVDRQGVLYEAHMRQQRLQEVVDHAVSAFRKYETHTIIDDFSKGNAKGETLP